ncbi:Alpha-1,6-mannosyl-glycoprotein 2-beta-N-acetylglucosaminyltransferase [Quillaja saponaria]|uniref:Alpha-1,6-mannosyl-glycoprotein 2-beta-N-acetylglucosaminyltransferase n=1 Tax=Quillaja saponaria TaxID=32244 RepID=A0AAD7LWI5_QUISA|nr:Alpha-1,6-mannosyl-glycoprotein 2-beta-N-acetylglucosaminyltransferase [Quillaja saponaria]
MATHKKSNLRDAALKRLLSVVFITLCGVLLLIFLVGTNSTSIFISRNLDEVLDDNSPNSEILSLPKQNHLSVQLGKRNQFPPRNLDLYPNLAKDHIIVVLYVHNRPQYLKVVVDSLSRVEGINETLLIVSHDGYFEGMNTIIESIRFCQVKQIFAPYSPHLFSNSFPGVSPTDCEDKDDEIRKHCKGNADQRPRNTSDHILFIEEDHFIFPNAYRNMQILTRLKSRKCADCYAANLAPCDVKARGEGWDSLVAERMGNVGYSFNRSVWGKIHKKAKEFCFFDDYNWDITMWATVYPSFGGPVYTLRGPRTSAIHFGKCGLHQGQGEKNACIDNGRVQIGIEEIDKVPNINSEWDVHVYKHQPGYQAGFKGWGGWGDERDHRLCLNFANMYHSINSDSPL